MQGNREAQLINLFSHVLHDVFGNSHLHKAKVNSWLGESLKPCPAPGLPNASVWLRVKSWNPTLSLSSVSTTSKSGKLDSEPVFKLFIREQLPSYFREFLLKYATLENFYYWKSERTISPHFDFQKISKYCVALSTHVTDGVNKGSLSHIWLTRGCGDLPTRFVWAFWLSHVVILGFFPCKAISILEKTKGQRHKCECTTEALSNLWFPASHSSLNSAHFQSLHGVSIGIPTYLQRIGEFSSS